MSRLARLGLFILGTLSILAIGIFIIGDKQFLFSSTYRLNATFDTVAGLPDGAEVRIGGVRKGTVDHIQMPRSPNEKVLIAMDLDRSTRQIIRRDSVASIETEGLLGNKFVSVSFGSKDGQPIHDGDSIPSATPFDFSDLMKKTNEILDRTQSSMQNVEEATADIKAITSAVRGGEGTVGALIKDKTLYRRLNDTTVDMRETAAEAKSGVTSFQENMEALKHNWFLRGYFKNRGYMDPKELTKYEIPALPQRPELKRFTYAAKDLFDTPEAAKLKNEKSLNKVGKFLEQNSFGLAVVISTAMKANSEEDRVLNQARALVVRQYLVEKFKLNNAQLKTKSVEEGGQNPAQTTERVDVVVYPAG
jgi:phospholipid/cholesterol/gamma-HCH transport system substrate-binding protein